MKTLVTFALVLTLTGAARAADMPQWKMVAGWDIRVDTTLGYGCFLVAGFEGGTTFRLGFDKLKNGSGYVMLHNPEWRALELGKDYQIQTQFDAETPWKATAQATTLASLTVLKLEFDQVDFLKEFMRKQGVVFRYQGRTLALLSLRGSQLAGDELIKCQAAFNAEAKRTTPSRDPFVSANKPAAPRDPFSY